MCGGKKKIEMALANYLPNSKVIFVSLRPKYRKETQNVTDNNNDHCYMETFKCYVFPSICVDNLL